MIDARPLFLILLLGFVLLSSQLLLAQRGALQRLELRIWAQGTRIMLCGFAMLVMRHWLPLWVSVLFGNGLVLLAVALYTQALYRHVLDRPAPRWYWALLAAMVPVLLLTLDTPVAFRVGLYSVLIAALLLPGARLALVGGVEAAEAAESRGPLIRSVGAVLALSSLMLVVRAAHALLSPHDYLMFYDGSPAQSLSVLAFFLVLGGGGFGFLLSNVEREARRMQTLATVDGLTGCYNRSTTDAMLAHALRLGERERHAVAFALLDLDHFKQINDRHGHQAGDAVLRAFAREARRCLRVSDVLGRVGGEEFGLILTGTDERGALLLLEDIRAAVEGLALRDGQGRLIPVTVSAGVCVAEPGSGLGAAGLYMLADRALYRAKHEGRNRAVCQGGRGERSDGAAPRPPLPARSRVP